MRKQVLFSVMLMLGAVGGLSVYPVPAMASVQQTVKVSGQVVDQEGEALIGATVKLKGAQTGVITDFGGRRLCCSEEGRPDRFCVYRQC